VRATPHDELMREAGFETDYHRELDRRVERRRRLKTRTLVLVGALNAALLAFIHFADAFGHVPRFLMPLVVAILTLNLAFVAFRCIVSLKDMKHRFLQWIEDQI
jgi:hypothetical protein